MWQTAALLNLAGCATAPLDRAGSLQSYDSLAASDGVLTHSLLNVSRADILAAKTVKIIPTTFAAPHDRAPFNAEQRNLVTNAVDRTLCAGLSERFAVVGATEPADLTVHAVVTHVDRTDPVAAGLSKGAAVAKMVLLPGVPAPVPRIPIGLGSLSLEAEARDVQGRQKAAMIWGRGANAFLGSGRVAEEGDAYSLASDFGGDFSQLLVSGETPFGKLPPPPSMGKIGNMFGRAPKYPACEAFGKSPGLAGVIGEGIGLPPDWTDNGAPMAQN
jgi:phosphohistidine swiveling domain-containing protein